MGISWHCTRGSKTSRSRLLVEDRCLLRSSSVGVTDLSAARHTDGGQVCVCVWVWVCVCMCVPACVHACMSVVLYHRRWIALPKSDSSRCENCYQVLAPQVISTFDDKGSNTINNICQKGSNTITHAKAAILNCLGIFYTSSQEHEV